jgi:acetyl esterase/lipase
VHRDLPYVAGGHERQKLDLYVPEHGEGPFPLIVWVHGGAWRGGDKSGCPPLRNGSVERGFAVASIGYRLSNAAKFPAQIEDSKAAIRWLRAHAKEYRLDPDRIGAQGSSAGGHLVALLGTTGDVRELDVGAHLEHSSRVQAVCDYYGPTAFLQMDAHSANPGHEAPGSPESMLVGGPIRDPAVSAIVRLANPITHVSKDDAPFLIVHGSADPAVPHHQSELLFAALTNAGVPVRFITVEGGGHGAGFPSAELNPIIGEFFDRHLKDGAKPAGGGSLSIRSSVKAGAVRPRKSDAK